MKKLMTGVAHNLSRGADHATMVLPASLLVMSIAWFNDKPFLFWATTFLGSLMAIGMICRQFLK
jgi:hypothetical protein